MKHLNSYRIIRMESNNKYIIQFRQEGSNMWQSIYDYDNNTDNIMLSPKLLTFDKYENAEERYNKLLLLDEYVEVVSTIPPVEA